MKRQIPCLLAALATLPAFAADPLYEEGFSLRLGGFYSSSDTTLRIDASNGTLGTSLSLEDDLGFEKSKTLPVFDAVWRINPRHRLELGYVSLARDSQRTLSGEVRFGDQVFPVSTDVNAKFDSDVWRLAYGWSFYREGGNELALLLGVHVTEFSTKLETAGGGIAEAADRTIPLPTVGLQGTWEISPKWRLNAWAQVFSLNYNDYEGSLVSGAVNLEYRFERNFAVGLGYMMNDYDLDVTKGRARGSFDYQFSGPMASVTVGF
jgi:hypothetical protein